MLESGYIHSKNLSNGKFYNMLFKIYLK